MFYVPVEFFLVPLNWIYSSDGLSDTTINCSICCSKYNIALHPLKNGFAPESPPSDARVQSGPEHFLHSERYPLPSLQSLTSQTKMWYGRDSFPNALMVEH